MNSVFPLIGRWSLAMLVMLPVSASAMSVGDFLGKADALKAKGIAAMFSSDIGLLKAEVTNAAASYRAEVAAGKPPRSCPPPKGTVKMDSDELIANFRTIPAAQRASTSVRTAFANYMAKRFPCR
jgi:hypothetical protein